jgi:serine/threonine protein kinase
VRLVVHQYHLFHQLQGPKLQDLVLTQVWYAGGRERGFVDLLKDAGIHRPDQEVLASIVNRCSYRMLAAASTGNATLCYELYQEMKQLPSTTTRGMIEQQEHISLNGPMFDQLNILSGVDLHNGDLILVKLLILPIRDQSTAIAELYEAVQLEAEISKILTAAEIPGIVKSEVVTVHIHDNMDLNTSKGPITALKMQRYYCSLAECPQLSENIIQEIFHRILEALKGMHSLGYVHMDVKSKNILVGAKLSCSDLCDFGSARKVGKPTFSRTAPLNPYVIPLGTPVIPSMDYVQLCVTVAVELQKDSAAQLYKDFEVKPGEESFSIGGHKVYHVDQDLICQRLQQIQNEEFREMLLNMYTEHLNKVKEHLQQQKSASQQGL